MVANVADIEAMINELDGLIKLLEADPRPDAKIKFGNCHYTLNELKGLLQKCKNELHYALVQKRNKPQKIKSVDNIKAILKELKKLSESFTAEPCGNSGANIKVGNYSISEFKCLLQRCENSLIYAQAQAQKTPKISTTRKTSTTPKISTTRKTSTTPKTSKTPKTSTTRNK